MNLKLNRLAFVQGYLYFWRNFQLNNTNQLSLEIIEVCPICQHTAFSHFLTCKDYTVSKEDFNLQKCKSCGFVLTSPRPIADEIGSYYQSEAYISHSDTQRGLINQLYHKVRKIALRNKLALLEKYFPQKGKLLDNGCGTGAFVKFALGKAWQAEGIEPDEKTRIFATQQSQTNIWASLDELPPENKYQAITMWHVLEHIADLHAAIEKMKSLLADKGLFFVALPNRECKDALHFKEHWAAYDVPRHLWHFRKKDVENLFAKHQLNLKAVFPMPFDAFYISMLSTKYQSGNISYLKAVWQGLQSNWAGGRDNTSSLIYVIGNY